MLRFGIDIVETTDLGLTNHHQENILTFNIHHLSEAYECTEFIYMIVKFLQKLLCEPGLLTGPWKNTGDT